MKIYLLKSFLLTCLLFFTVLIGMQIASQGIQKTRGMEDERFKPAVQIEKSKSGNMEAAVLGQKLTEKDLLKKQKKLEEMKAFNPISAIGSFLSNKVDAVVNGTINKIFGQ